ncbi:MAG: hypothetical protein CM1200mP14_24030 [Gammaproteobacteria bacterium]|nr:MAG: hypothetical protein CM1200mP14_24030 [Gammaproteobacteria bacterium]
MERRTALLNLVARGKVLSGVDVLAVGRGTVKRLHDLEINAKHVAGCMVLGLWQSLSFFSIERDLMWLHRVCSSNGYRDLCAYLHAVPADPLLFSARS